MPRQIITLGAAQFTPFSGFAVPISTNYTPSTSDVTSNLTGAISPAAGTLRPLMVSSLTVKFRTGGGSGFLFCSNNSTRTGSVTSTSSSINSFNGDVSRVLDFPALIGSQLFYGFDKTNTTQTNFSTGTRSGSNVFSSGSVLFSDRAIFADLQLDTVPSAVQSLSASASQPDRISVSWSAPSDDGGQAVTGFQVAYKRTQDSVFEFLFTSNTSILITGLNASSTYDIIVGARNPVTTKHNSQFGFTGAQAHTGTAATTQATTPAGLPVFTDTTLANGTQGVFYSDGVSATNATSFSLVSGSLPSGLSLSSNNGSITGTPSVNGFFAFTVSANNSFGSTTANVSLTVNPPAPVFTDQTLQSPAFLGAFYSDGVNASNATAYNITAGSLPNGLSLNTSTGSVTGTPTTEQTSNFTIQASNVTGTISAGFTIEVVSGLQPPSFIDQTLDNDLRAFIEYSDGVTASNSPTFSISAGTFVPGLNLNSSTGAVTGTPTAQGEYSFTISATNAAGSDTASFTLNVKPGIRRYDGTQFVFATIFKRYNGTEFVDVIQTRRFNGTIFVPADL